MTAVPGPVQESERAEILDVLRGFALLGIFVAHFPGFSGWDYLAASDRAALLFASDPALQFLRDLFVRGKFYALFSLLFGFGFAIQYASARRRGEGFGAHFRRRQLGLLVIGLVHSAFWHGDILVTYAVLGLVMIPLADWKPRRLFAWGCGLIGARVVWVVVAHAVAASFESVGDAAIGSRQVGTDVVESVGMLTAGYSSEHWAEMLATNAAFLRIKWLLMLYDGRFFTSAGCFLLGIAFGRWRVHERIDSLRPELWRVLRIAAPVGIAANLCLAFLWPLAPTYPPTALGLAADSVFAFAAPVLAIAFAAGISLLWVNGVARRALAALAPPGRMALTSYLAQTAIGIGIFYGVGFGFRGSISLTQTLAIALLIYSVQAVFARIWLQVFLFGPVEWAWRCATYGRWLPLRRVPIRTPAVGSGTAS